MDYTGEPATGFTEYITPIQPIDIYSTVSPDAMQGSNTTKYPFVSRVPEQNSCAPILADFASELCGTAGAVCGAIGGWQRANPLAPPAQEAEAAGKTALPAVRLLKDQLAQCFGWLPLWKAPALTTTIELSERYAPRIVPMFRGGLAGCITGALGGYALGYITGSIADWCGKKLIDGFNLLTQDNTYRLSNEINSLKYKYEQTSNGSSEYASMQYWTSQYSTNQALYENNTNYRDKIDRGYIAISAAAGEAFLQRGSQIPSADLSHPQYILKNTSYDLGSVALGYLLDAQAALDDDNSLPNCDHKQLAVCATRIDEQIKNVIQNRHNMLAVLQELVDSGYGATSFDTWRKCVRESLDRKFMVSPELQNRYEAKCWRDLALLDLCLVSTGVHLQDGNVYLDEMHHALESASELDPENPDLLQLKQLSVTLQN